MTDPEFNHLLRRQVFGAGRSLLYVSDPVVRGDNVAHDHDFVELVLVAGGSGTHVSTRGAQTVSRGDLFTVRPGAWHAYQGCRDLHVYNCCCAPELLRRELALIADDPGITRLLWTDPLAPGARGVLHHRMTEAQTDAAVALWKPLAERSGEAFTVRAGRLLMLLGWLAETVYPNEPQGQGGMHSAVRRGVQLLEDACEEEWDLARLAAQTRLNASYLTRLFKAATGRSPMAYLARHRAERAANLLLATDLPVGEIGARVGWSDPNYFARRFKSVFGATPSAYRERRAVVDSDVD
jgi:AraC family L-rhamnose operon transcriptional activator RhaR